MKTLWYERTASDLCLENCVGLLSVGSCEQHSHHLPVGTDGFLGWRLVQAAANRAACDTILLPPQFIGYSPHHRAWKGYLTLTQQTMFSYYLELCRCAFDNGLQKLIIVNAHGGNQSCLQTVVNELGAQFGYRAILVRYWDLISDEVAAIRQSGPGGMGHAGEFETSLMQYLYPELVQEHRILQQPPATGNAYHHPDMFAKNTVYQYKPFDEYSADGNVGQPQFASSREGAALFDAAADALAKLIDTYHMHTF